MDAPYIIDLTYPPKDTVIDYLLQGRKKDSISTTLKNKYLKNSYVLFIPKLISIEAGSIVNLLNDVNNIGDLGNSAIKAFNSLKNGIINTASKSIRDTFDSQLNSVYDFEDVYIALPFKSLVTNETHSWGHQAVMKATVGNIISAISSALETVGSIGSKEFVSKLGDTGGKVVNAGASILSDVMTNSSKELISQMGAYVTEPQKSLYSGSQALSFNFDYTFIPANKEHADLINNIIKMFRYFSNAQQPIDTKGTGSFIVRSNPAVWLIKFPPDLEPQLTKDNTYYCICNSVNVTYGDEGFMKYFDMGDKGVIPSEIKLSVSFTEYFIPRDAKDVTGILDKKDIIKGAKKRPTEAQLKFERDYNDREG